MNFRHEVKYEIGYQDMLILRERLRAVASPDIHAVNGKYEIRSLYFDNIADKVLMEKVNGLNHREKFRIRYYNGDTSVIFLEKKSKRNDLGSKQSVPLSAMQAQDIVLGNLEWMRDCEDKLVRELYFKMTTQGMTPKTIVDYTREPFVFPAGNVRVTLDYDIRSGLGCTDFLNPDCITVPVTAERILEVKWDHFLPDVIRDAVALADRREGAFSKYAACRIYG